MRNYRNELLEELRQEGISDKDSEELLQIAFELSNLSVFRRSYDFKKNFLEKLPAKKEKKLFFGFSRFIIPALAVLVLLLGSSTVVMAQKSLPGEPLYPVKRISEDIIVIVNPEFKKERIIRRSEEVKKAAEDKKELNILQDSIKEYKLEFKKTTEQKSSEDKKNDNKEAIEKSKKNLKDAREKSVSEKKKELEKIIEHIEKEKTIQTEVKGDKNEKSEKDQDEDNSIESEEDKKKEFDEENREGNQKQVKEDNKHGWKKN